MKAASNGNLDPLEKLAEDWKAVGEEKGFLAKGLAAASLVMAAGTISDAASGIDELKQGEYTKAIEDLASAGQSGLEIVAGATKALADAGKLAEYTEKGLSFAEFASKLAPGLGVIANSAAFVNHIKDAGETKNAGFAIAALEMRWACWAAPWTRPRWRAGRTHHRRHRRDRQRGRRGVRQLPREEELRGRAAALPGGGGRSRGSPPKLIRPTGIASASWRAI